ncbi:glycosyl hydrolase family 28-related protein [Neobacillus cucumis]|uniref:glycosyl hydrolase family 28-related protein n=1 Tax=Neobacillus cucumis TaxID=1740721 RepID=UPI0028531447|nr:glycosyl hydrolase family 28-related protein [Neobacillus cucumis]MDR4949949.1 glycosyl hydrolase family 28-related protein [Neobacillus cucumis]
MINRLIVASGILILVLFTCLLIGRGTEKTNGISEKEDYSNGILGKAEKNSQLDILSSTSNFQKNKETSLLNIKNHGTTYERPSGIPLGFIYYDTTLKRTIYWNGKSWVENSVFNIKDIGAKGDGKTDDTKAIQNALNLARENIKITIYFPKGIYNTKTLRIYKNTSVNLDKDAVIKRIGYGYKLFVNGKWGDPNYAYGYNGEGNIHFKGGTIDLNTNNFPLSNDKGTTAFDLSHADNLSFRNLTIKNGQNGHYFQIASDENVIFEGCWFGDVRYTNFSSKNFELIQLEESRKISFPSFGGYDGTISKNITIKNCHFENVIRAIGTHSFPRAKDGITPLRYVENVRVINNTFKNSVSEFGHFEGFKNLIFENNLFENYGEYPIYLNKTINASVKNNYFKH